MYGQKGFTVIEVTIFLAISGLLVLIAFAGTSRLISTTRFTDDVRSLESYVQRQYEEVSNGVNDREGREICTSAGVSSATNSAPGTSDCVLLGKSLVFTNGSRTIQSRYVVGFQSTPINPTQSTNAAIAAFNPRVVTNVGASSFDSPWGSRFTGAIRQDGNTDVNAVAFLKSPNSAQIVTYLYVGTPTSPTTLGTMVGATSNSSTSAIFCIKDDSAQPQKAALNFTNGQGSSAINALFEPARARC